MRIRSTSVSAFVHIFACVVLVCLPSGLAAQRAPSSQEAALPHAYGYVEQVMRALDSSRTIVYRALAGSPAGDRDRVDQRMFGALVDNWLAVGETPTVEDFAGEGLAPGAVPSEVQELLDRTDALYWSLLTVAADPDPNRLEREGEGLVQAYEAQTGLSSVPVDMASAQSSIPWGAFAQAYPRLHGLIWAQTWLRLAVFEPLLVYRSPQARQAGLSAVLARFWNMLDEAPLNFPTAMPMAPTIAQSLSYLSPQAAAILENEDMLRESVGDILVSESMATRSEALLAAAKGFQDGGFRPTSRFAWRQMALMHGVENQGGFALGIITTLQEEAMGMNRTHMANVMPGMTN